MEDPTNLFSFYIVNSSALNMRNFQVSEEVAVGAQARLPLNVLQWYIDLIELKLLKK